ncbi:MAG: metallophosphoesterase family protein [Deltaproteobacteria bacterium]|nr:MAG: metallophosphoesterase family protein [Deltaproteobacteria bacterium]
MNTGTCAIGVVSDSHGHVDDEILAALRGVDLILHAGDIGHEGVLVRLRACAPVVAVAGNGDAPIYHRYPWDQRVEVGSTRLLLCHWYDNFGRIHPKIARELEEFRPHALVYGHTHEALNERRRGTLFFNPGYAGPPLGGRPRSVGRLFVDETGIRGELLPLGGA